jgi:RND family efflux transporter MFP subunit
VNTNQDSRRGNGSRPGRIARGALTILVVAGVAGGLVAIGGTVEPYGSVLPQPTPPLAVAVERAEERAGYEVVREFVGVVEARRESAVGFELGGEVIAVHFDEGAFVEAGAAVAQLDTTILEAERSMLLASRNQARAAAELAGITRERIGGALEKDAVSAHRWDEADKDHEAQLATLARAEAAIAAIDARISKAELRAPFAALVAERYVDEGQVIAAGTPVLHLLESAAPEVRIGVSGAAIDTVFGGQRHTLRVRDRSVRGEVRSVLPVRGNGTRSVDVIFTLDAELDGIRRGDLATLDIVRTRDERGFWLPLTALTESSRGLWACYVAEALEEVESPDQATHRLGRRELEVVHQAGDEVYVRGTLQGGEQVVTEGLHRLVPDQLVRLATGDAFSTWRAGS